MKRQRRSRETLVVLCVSCALVAVAHAQVAWRSGAAPRSQKTAAEVLDTLAVPGLRGAGRHVVVQFDTPVTPVRRGALAEAGVTLQRYLGNDAYFARVAPNGADRAALAAVGTPADAQEIRAAWKLDPVLAGGRTPTWAVVPPPDAPASPEPAETWIGAYVMFHDDVAPAEGVQLAQAAGLRVRQQLISINALVVEMPLAQVELFAASDAVMYVEPALPRMSMVNDNNRVLTQADSVQAPPYSLDGSGVTVLVYDGGTALETHVDFGGRLTVHDASGTNYHSTHVAGTIGGSGAASGGTYKGMAPGTTLLAYGYEDDGTGIFLYNNPGDLESDYSEAINIYGADIANNSIGTNTALFWDCEITGDYGVTSALLDAIVRGSLGAPFRVIWANGNERQTTRCGNLYSTTAPPAGAKNHITVGAVNSNDDTMTDFSSWGPVDDGRLKPDISAPGCQSNDDFGVTSTTDWSDTAYETLCGTSMAAPTVTGLAALLIEDYRAQFSGQPLFRNAMLKCWLVHSAVDRGNPGPDYQFGYGSVRVQQAIDLMRSGAFLESSVSQGASFTRQVTVSAGDPELKVTLAWDDVAGTPNVNPALVNDLDLRVTSPTGVRHYPWTLDPANPANPAVRIAEDHVNNIEQVLVNNPESGTWTVEVYGFDVPQGPQSFALVGDGTIGAGLSVTFPNGLPTLLAPAIPQALVVQITTSGESVVPTSPTMYYRYDGGPFQPVSLMPLGGGLYQGSLPATTCGDAPEYYFSAEGSISGIVTSPSGAPGSTYSAAVGTVLFSDDFESDRGWTATNLGASTGDWERSVPINDPDWQYDPLADADGSGQCFVTLNQLGNTDVDDGAVALTSPVIDMSVGDIVITYAYYLNLTDASGVDALVVAINNNAGSGSWTEIARHDTDGATSWRLHSITQADLDSTGVPLTPNMVLRFTANDSGTATIVEAGVDAVKVATLDCLGNPTCSDGFQNQGEERIDCGGPCAACQCTSDAACDNEAFCDGPESCDPFGQCQNGTAPCIPVQWCAENAATCQPYGDGDFDGDLDVDLVDFHDFQECLGQSAEFAAGCAAGNLLGPDGLINLADYAEFATRLEGSGPH